LGCQQSGRLRAGTAHLSIRPNLEIGYREVFEKRVGFDYLLARRPAGCIGRGHDERRVGNLNAASAALGMSAFWAIPEKVRSVSALLGLTHCFR
jgi:hypothetical protein